MSEIHEFTGSYALAALDPAELAEFEAHLATCGSCRDEVAEYSETAAELLVFSLATPPPILRDDILHAIRETQQLPMQDQGSTTGPPVGPSSIRPPEPAPRTAARRALPGSELPDEPQTPQLDEVALRRLRRRTRVLTGLVAAMLALTVGLGGVIYTLLHERHAQIAQITLEQQLYDAPDATQVTSDVPGGGQVTFIASKQLNRALFVGTDLPDPGTNRYQLWTGTGNPSKENGITRIDRDKQIVDTGAGAKIYFSGDVAGSDFLAVNLEPAGSTPDTPTNRPLAAALI